MATKIPGGKPREQREPLLHDGRGIGNLADESMWPAQQQQDAGARMVQVDDTSATTRSSGRPPSGGFIEKFRGM